MPCYKPLKGWLGRDGKITFNASESYRDVTKEVPCGQCIGCKLERSRMWAVRCVNEASMHADNCSLTLTYAPENLPDGGTLVKADAQKFIKRLRKRIAPQKISYYLCGEYGDDLGRPHYHVLLFGYDFADKRLHKRSKSGHNLFSSELLDSIWGLGSCLIGDLTFDSAAYAARYVTKKLTGDLAEAHYAGRLPEFSLMSTKPAIGARWFHKHSAQIYRRDRIVVNGVEQLPPRYYDKLLRRTRPEKFESVKAIRNTDFKYKPVPGKKKLTREQQREQIYNRSKSRLEVREEVTKARLNQYKRNLE